MKIGDGVVHGGTFTAHSVALAAADKTLEILAETDTLANIAENGEKLRAGIDRILTARGIPHSFAGHPAMSGLFFNSQPPSNYREWLDSDYDFYDALAQELHELGILVEPDSREPWFLSEAHDMECVQETLDKFAAAVDITMNKSPQERRKVATSYVQ